MENMKERESWEDYEKTQYISNRSPTERMKKKRKKKKRGKLFLKEIKVENFLELLKDINHKPSKKKNKRRRQV